LINVVIFKLTSNGKLEISKFSLEYCEFDSNGFIEMNGGILMMKESKFSNIKLKIKSLIKINGVVDTNCDALIEKCEFSDIELVNGNGSVIYSEINNGNEMKIKGIIFFFFLFHFYFHFYFVKL
jgi:hypothetical protein